MLKYFVYAQWGGCNEGDHTVILESYETLRDANNRYEELVIKYNDDITITMICGYETKHHA